MKIGIAGCTGRMGKMLIEAVREHSQCMLGAISARTDRLDHANTYLQREGLHHVVLTDNAETLAQKSDAIIDFTTPAYSLEVSASCASSGVSHICGTTGFNEQEMQTLRSYGETIPIVWAANFSIGVNLLIQLTQQVAEKLNNDYDIEISETHHRYKKDAPSGTALALGKAAAEGRGVEFSDVAEFGRNGITGERQRGTIGFHALRGGDVIGDHTVLFAGLGERIELSHLSSSRRIYADGAVHSAIWSSQQKSGFYNMQDVLRPPQQN